MIHRIIFLREYPFEERDNVRLGLGTLEENGFKVEAWDWSNIAHRNKMAPNNSAHFNAAVSHVIRFNDEKKFLLEVSALTKNDFVINSSKYIYPNLALYKALSKSRAFYAVSLANQLPMPRKTVSTYFNKVKKLLPLTPTSLRNLLLPELPFGWLGVRPVDLIFASGTKCFLAKFPINHKSEILWCHTLDYDLYLEEIKYKSTERPIAVFLDQSLDSHRDYSFFNVKPFAEKEEYRTLLKKFFSVIEKEFGLKVVIAAHPRASERENKKNFEGYERSKGKTIKLVREAKLILAHDTTALNMANLFNKPVIFMTYPNLDHTMEGPRIRAMSRWFGKSPIFIDRDKINIDHDKELKVDAEIYAEYKKCFIKNTCSEDKPFWQIVADRLKKGF